MATRVTKRGSGINETVLGKLRKIIKSDDLSTWDQAWREKVTPWDEGLAQPGLQEAVEKSGFDLPKSGRAFVPGCGVGYDAIYLATTLGLETIGIEISDTAIEEANKHLASLENPPAVKVTYIKADFFDFTVPEDEKFDLVYDYTFFTAIPPAKRLEWGQKIASLIKSGGYLIALVFPMLPETDAGPPYFLRPEHYDEPLGKIFEKLMEKVPDESLPLHVGKEKLLVWKRL